MKRRINGWLGNVVAALLLPAWFLVGAGAFMVCILLNSRQVQIQSSTPSPDS